MQARWLKRDNGGVEEKFYPITHISAIVMGEGENLDSLTTFAEKADKLVNPQCDRYTILASGWVGSSAPYTYTIPGYEGKTVEVLEDVTMTMEQLEVIENAKIKGDPTNEANILYAFGDKPNIDVPVILAIRS